MTKEISINIPKEDKDKWFTKSQVIEYLKSSYAAFSLAAKKFNFEKWSKKEQKENGTVVIKYSYEVIELLAYWILEHHKIDQVMGVSVDKFMKEENEKLTQEVKNLKAELIHRNLKDNSNQEGFYFSKQLFEDLESLDPESLSIFFKSLRYLEIPIRTQLSMEFSATDKLAWKRIKEEFEKWNPKKEKANKERKDD